MICLLDLGAVFWHEWFSHPNENDALSGTLHAVDDWSERFNRLVVCADSPRSLRREREPSYKAHRPPKPPEAVATLKQVKRRLAELVVPVALVDGHEADDVIATLCSQAWPDPVRIVSQDKDLTTLINEDVEMIWPGLANVTTNDVLDKYGVPPSSMAEWLCLVGDASDGIKGCPGVGPKKATALLERFSSIEGAQGATDEDLALVLGKSAAAKFRAWDPAVARDMVKLVDNLPLSLFSLLNP